MTSPAPRKGSNFLGHEFNRFLFAPVGTDQNGGQLSVVSALARLDLDAWAEAAALSRLPRDIAAQKLSNRLQKFTEIPRIAQDAGTISARLIALLPVNSNPLIQTAATKWSAVHAGGFAILLLLCLALGMLYGRMAPSSMPAWKSSVAATLASPPAPGSNQP